MTSKQAKDETGYNGWANYETWNVALWIGNDEGLYNMGRGCRDYAAFVEQMKQMGEDCGMTPICLQTPDGVAWNDSGLDTDELDAMMAEF